MSNRRLGPTKLPPGWVWTTLDELAEIVGGVTVDRKRRPKDPVTVPYLRVANVQRGYLDLSELKQIVVERSVAEALRLQPGDILLNEGGDRDKLGRGWVWRGERDHCIHQNHVFRARLRSPEILSEYVSYFANSEGAAYFEKAGKQTTNLASVSLSSLKKLPIKLPPAQELKRIVGKLAELFSDIEAGEQALDRASALVKRYTQSVLKAALTGELTREWREKNLARLKKKRATGADLLARILKKRRATWETAELGKLIAKGKDPKDDKWKQRYVEPAPPQIDHLPELPYGWVWASPEQLKSAEPHSLAIGPFGSNLVVRDYRDEGVPLIFVRHIRTGNFAGQSPKFVTRSKAAELAQHRARGGDILVTKMGDPPGDACLYPWSRPEAIITADCIKWTPHKEFPSRQFIVHAINSSIVATQIRKLTKGVAQQKISLELFRTIAVPVPPPEEMEMISEVVEAELSNADAAVQSISNNRLMSTLLRRSVFDLAFRGKLVPQDQREEAASILLERIREARAQTTIVGSASHKVARPTQRRGRTKQNIDTDDRQGKLS